LIKTLLKKSIQDVTWGKVCEKTSVIAGGIILFSFSSEVNSAFSPCTSDEQGFPPKPLKKSFQININYSAR
jgi:hypothetical protein